MSTKKVPYPKDDEVISLTGLAGDTIDLGFNPQNTQFFERDGDLVAIRPNGQVTVYEGFTAALDSDAPPVLLVNGKPLATADLLVAQGGDLEIQPAGEDEAPTQEPTAGGTSSYDENLVPDLGETQISLTGFEDARGSLGSGSASESGSEDETFVYELESVTASGSSSAPADDALLPSGKARKGYGKGGKKKALANDDSSDGGNAAPTDLDLSNAAVLENSAAGTLVGTVSAVDPDGPDSIAFQLLDNAGGRFVIDEQSGEVTVAGGDGLDYETATSHDIIVRATDGGGLFRDEKFSISVLDQAEGSDNGAPSAIGLDNLSVDENIASALIGALSVDDPDSGDSHTYSVDDDRFEIVGGQLKLKDGIALDHEAEDQVSLTITATDTGSLSISETFALAVLDVNEAPTDILLGTDVDENAPNGTLVKVAVAIDPDANETFHYELTDDAGGRFTIDSVSGAVTVADGTLLDYEAAESHEISIRVTDSGGKTYEETFTVHINDVNEAPTGLDLSNDAVFENSPAGSLVGTVSAADSDGGESFTYALLDDAGGRFAIDKETGEVTVAGGAGLDYEVATTHDIRVQVTDSGGLAYDESFVISVMDLAEGSDNSAPAAIVLDNLSVDENMAGALIGSLSVDDPDAGGSHSFTVDDDRFEIVGNQLKLKDGTALNHEAEDQISLTVTAADGGGLAFAQLFNIAVNDLNEAPTDILLGTDVDENAPNGALVKVAVAIDPDENDSFTYELIDDAEGRFAINPVSGEVTVANGAALDYEAAASHDITVKVTDSGGETYQETFTVHVNDVNEAPTGLTISANSVSEGSANNTVMGVVSAVDPDQGDSANYSLIDDANGRFSIDALTGELRVADGTQLDSEASTSHSVVVGVSDGGGLSYQKSFEIEVTDVSEGSSGLVPGPAFFVAPWGNDGNSGTEDQPFATLGRARDAMRADPDIDTTYVRGGTYYLSETLQLGAQDSGVTFAAYPGESVVLSGGELVTGFTAEGGGLYSVALAQPSGLDLTIAGEGLRVASSGVYDSANPYTSGWLFADAAGGGASKTTFRFAEGDITPDQISSSTLVQVYESARWGARTQSVEAPKEIQSIDFSSNSLTMEAAYKYALDTGSTYRLLNDADLISGLGEFAWRAEDGRLVVNPEDSSLLLSEGAVVARLDTLMQLDGADGVQIFGFTFSDVPYTGTALQVNDTDNALIAYNTFKNIGVGIELNGASHNTIFSNELMNLADEGIRLLGGSDFNQVAANYIHNIGVIYKHTAGIQLLDASDNTIAHNQIEDSARYGIALIEESNLRNIIEYNTVLRTSRETFDSGAINMWGKNVDGVDSQTIIRYNYIEDTGGLRTSSTKEWFANWGGKGIYLDDRASGVEIYGNFIKDANQALIQIHGGDQILIQNNVAILDGQKTLNHKGINNYDNFVYLQKQVNGGPGSELVDITIDGNIIYAVSPISDYWQYSNGGNPIVENNLLFNVPKWSAPSTGTPDAGSIIADPLFADPENGDYSLLTASPALSLGFTDLPYDQMGLDGADPLAALGDQFFNEAVLFFLGLQTAVGTDGDDVMYGSSGSDLLFGLAGNDQIDGGAGNDLVVGGIGADAIDVSNGHDVVLYETSLDAGDLITGFYANGGEGDVISLDRLFDNLGVGTEERYGRIDVRDNGTTQDLRVDTNGNGGFDLLLASIEVIDSNLLEVNRENAAIEYGSL